MDWKFLLWRCLVSYKRIHIIQEVSETLSQKRRRAPCCPQLSHHSGKGDCAFLLVSLQPTRLVDVLSSPVVMSSGNSSDQSRRVSVLSWDQVRRLDSILGESVPIHGRGNFPTLSVQPREIVQVRPRSIQLSSNPSKINIFFLSSRHDSSDTE